MPNAFLLQLEAIKRFHKDIAPTLPKRFFQSGGVGDGRHQDHRDLIEVLLDLLEYRKAVRAGYLKIQQDAIDRTSDRCECRHQSQAMVAAPCRDGIESHPIQPTVERSTTIEIVIDDDDEPFHE